MYIETKNELKNYLCAVGARFNNYYDVIIKKLSEYLQGEKTGFEIGDVIFFQGGHNPLESNSYVMFNKSGKFIKASDKHPELTFEYMSDLTCIFVISAGHSIKLIPKDEIWSYLDKNDEIVLKNNWLWDDESTILFQLQNRALCFKGDLYRHNKEIYLESMTWERVQTFRGRINDPEMFFEWIKFYFIKGGRGCIREAYELMGFLSGLNCHKYLKNIQEIKKYILEYIESY